MDRQQMERCLEQVAAYRASGQKARAWAEANGVPAGTLQSWCAHAQRWQAAVRGMHAIYRPGYNMAKAGVQLLDLQDGRIEQHELALDGAENDRSTLMTAIDRLNVRYGRGAVAVASGGTTGDRRQWVMRQELKTPDYTTCWDSMPVARA